jgi:alcohol dehydrogenase
MPVAVTMVLEAPRLLVKREFALPRIQSDDALLRVEACGLCGTDHEEYSGHLFGGFAFIPGHESVGVIEAIGDAAAQRWGVCAGDRVAVEVFQSCRTCGPCLAGDYRHCGVHGVSDTYGFIPVDRAPSLWGGYAQYQYLGPDSKLLKVPSGLDPVTATLFNPLGAGIRWGATLPQTGPGSVVAVLGPGIRGLCAVVAARQAGAAFVLATGRGARDQRRLEAARRAGADLVVDVAQEDPARALVGAIGRLADVAVDVTAKAPDALDQAVRLTRPGGTVVVAGTRGGDGTAKFNSDSLVYKEIHIVGALGVEASSYENALELLSAQRVLFADIDRRIVGFEEIGLLLESLSAGAADTPLHSVFVPE